MRSGTNWISSHSEFCLYFHTDKYMLRILKIIGYAEDTIVYISFIIFVVIFGSGILWEIIGFDKLKFH